MDDLTAKTGAVRLCGVCTLVPLRVQWGDPDLDRKLNILLPEQATSVMVFYALMYVFRKFLGQLAR
jgi:hypothetical protein